MGRTLPTQIQLLRQAEEEWKGFRRALRKEDQSLFDALWRHARRHGVAAAQAERPLPFEAHVLAMLLGLKQELNELRAPAAEPPVFGTGVDSGLSKNQAALAEGLFAPAEPNSSVPSSAR